jgi:hypothetical protein
MNTCGIEVHLDFRDVHHCGVTVKVHNPYNDTVREFHLSDGGSLLNQVAAPVFAAIEADLKSLLGSKPVTKVDELQF